jgi:pimeloyl-ACP methyl ester carboxylesterase
VSAEFEPPGDVRPQGRAVLLHGVMSLAGGWWRIGPELARRGLRTRALDLPAHGDAPSPPGPLDLDALADGAQAGLPSGRIDLLVGHSLGAAVALTLAARAPQRVGALVLEDPPGLRGIDVAELAAGIEADSALVRSDRAGLVAREHAANPGWAAEDVERSVDGIAQADAEVVAAGLRHALRWDLPALVRAARPAVLVLAAPEERSALAGREREEVRAALPGGRFVVLEGGHCLHRDDPEAWLRAVDAFRGS